MKGDFSRDTFHQLNHYARVLHQQGRVQVDSDVNEQTSILLHLLRTLGADVIGPHGGPKDGLGFEITGKHPSVMVEQGHYYIDGLLVENETSVFLRKTKDLEEPQPYYRMPLTELDLLISGTKACIIYLDAWEHHLTHLENDHIREVALGGPDTATRAQVVWQVRVTEAGNFKPDDKLLQPDGTTITKLSSGEWKKWIDAHEKPRPKMRAQIKDDKPADPDPCSISPEARYRGLENQLYRVEIHQGGDAKTATFKWSRENGSVLTRWVDLQGNKLTVANPRGFKAGDWIELLDDWHELERIPGTLAKVVRVEGDVLTLDLTATVGALKPEDFIRNPKVRRWDYVAPVKTNPAFTLGADGAVNLVEVTGQPTDPWIPLEYGLEIQFQRLKVQYRTGDYWLIPARVLLPPPGQIEWPNNENNSDPTFLEPNGVQHHYAPLAFWNGALLTSLRRTFKPLVEIL